MKSKIFLATVLFTALSLFFISCGGKDKKKDDGKTETTVGPTKGSDDGVVPKIDTANLKDEASILAAMQQYVDAQVAVDKKQKEDAAFDGHFVEMTNLHSAILRASTAYSKTITDPNKSVEFMTKVSDIEKKMYGQ